jgi:hypothetical protein
MPLIPMGRPGPTRDGRPSEMGDPVNTGRPKVRLAAFADLGYADIPHPGVLGDP